MSIKENYQKIREEIPEDILVVVASKTRTPAEIVEVIEAGATDIGENYVQEAEKMKQELGEKANTIKWHMIGHLQKNKINKALQVFDVIQTIDSLEKIRGLNIPNVDMKYLSMGMTNSYRVAIEEGSNMVRIGTAIFGERKY